MTEGNGPRDIVHLNLKTTGTRADDRTLIARATR
jgi:hypothetical protein